MIKRIQLYWFFPLFVAVLVTASVVVIDRQINLFRDSYFSALEQEISLRNRLFISVCKTIIESGLPQEKMQALFLQQSENPFILRIKKRRGAVVFETASTPGHLKRILNVPRIRKIMRGPAHNEVFFEYNPYFKTYFAYNSRLFRSNGEDYVLLMAEQCDSVTRIIRLSEFAILTLSAMGAIIVAGLILYFLNQVRSPLKRLKISTRAIASGKFNYPVYVPSSGVVREIAISVRDMAERLNGQIVMLRKFEEQRREFFGAISHAMKTPLTGILSAVEGIEQGALENPEYRAECIRAIKIQSTRLSILLHDFLSLNAIELQESKKERDFLPVYLSELVAEAAENCSHAAEKVKFKFDFPSEREVQVNPMLFVQALENLIINACLHGESENIGCFAMYGDTVSVLEICDDGKGIVPDDREKVFERFYRGANHRQGPVPGNGLGLFIVKRIVELHNGTVVLADGYDNWKTVFRITIPNRQDL